jgi:transmembrane sensor
MSPPANDSDTIDGLAADWVARVDTGALSRADAQALDAWLAQDRRHHGAYVRAQAAWALAEARTEPAAPPVRKPTSRRAAIAAGLVAGGAGLAGLWTWRASERVVTARGEVLRAPLSDGSLAVINTDSRLDLAIGRKRRGVRLARGEAWFEVAKDPSRPFTVALGDLRVQAVGTAFSVRQREDGAEVVVTEGVVAAWNVHAERAVLRLNAGDKAFLSSEPLRAPAVDRIGEVRAQRLMAWKDGLIMLEDRTLEEAVAEFNRYNDRKLVVEDPALGRRRLVGAFQANDPEGFVRALTKITDARAEERKGEILLRAD